MQEPVSVFNDGRTSCAETLRLLLREAKLNAYMQSI